MERKKPIPGSFYRHFKGQIYQIRGLAKNAETGEEMVVYQGMYPPFSVWVRPLDMFLEELDRTHCPQAAQKFRFQEVKFQEKDDAPSVTRHTASTPAKTVQKQKEMTEEISDDYLRQVLLDGQAEKKLSGRMTEEEIAQRGFLAMLDAESFRDKRRIFMGLQPYLTPLHLSNIAVALDIVLEEGNSQQHYDTILHCLETFEKYEGGRLRS
jgi:hypothetical protein